MSTEPAVDPRALRLALQRAHAARALGVSDETFDRYIRPDVKVVYIGTVRLYPVEELLRWLRENQRPAMMSGQSAPALREQPGAWQQEVSPDAQAS